jgi:hypothetical protein
MELWYVDYTKHTVELKDHDSSDVLNPLSWFKQRSSAYKALLDFLGEHYDVSIRELNKAKAKVAMMEAHSISIRDKIEELRKEITKR